MRNRDARFAGALYLVAIIWGFFGLEYLPGRFLAANDAAATAHAIAANPFLFRIEIFNDVLGGTIWLSVVLALYRLLKDVDRDLAGLMMILGGYMQVPLYFVNVVNTSAAFILATGASYLSAFSEPQRDALAMLFLRLHHYDLLASLFFAGVWLIPFGILVYKSGFLPRFLGVWLVLESLAWIAITAFGFLAPQYSDAVSTVSTPLTFGEIAVTLWLLIFGARPTIGRRREPASS